MESPLADDAHSEPCQIAPTEPGEILAYPARTEWDMGYRDLRKFNKFCLLVAESALKFEITVFASEPLLEC